jgi:hypothetical protein
MLGIMHLLLKMDVTNRFGLPLALKGLVESSRLLLPSAKYQQLPRLAVKPGKSQQLLSSAHESSHFPRNGRESVARRKESHLDY